MPPGSRDNFSRVTKDKLYRVAGGVCSNPDCRKHTTGATEDGTGIINVGKAAHIEAAAPGGPRYSAEMTSEQRSHADNGLWVCAACADLIDDDEKKYTVEILRGWKAYANREAHLRVATGAAAPSMLNAAADPSESAAVDRASRAVRDDLLLIRRQSAWPRHEIHLSYRLGVNSEGETVTVDGLTAGLEVNPELLLVSPPGTGKTTSIVQITSAMLERRSFVPLYVSLKEWAQQNEGIIESVIERGAFHGLSRDNFLRLANDGRLAVLLDGWNELGVAAKQRAIAALGSLRRDYPLLRIVTSTRREAVDLPFGGIRAEIQPLSEKQQMELAERIAGARGYELLQHAWHTPGLGELIALPLYISVLLANAPDGRLPETKEEVLGLFVAKHDNDPANSLPLREAVQGVHRAVLTALAFETTRRGDVAMTDHAARKIVANESKRLMDDGQITVALQPVAVLDILTARHVLVRSSDNLLSFQHQQFEEWFASWGVEQLMRSAPTDATALQVLRIEILDVPHWEEPILFAIERLSRLPGGDRVVATVIIETLTIDPMLAAQIVYRSSAATWAVVGRQVVEFALRWHKDGAVDRAVRFMIMSGREEFADTLWALLSQENSQIHLAAVRAAPRIRAGVLGSNVAARLRKLDDRTAGVLLSEFVIHGDMSTIELAVSLAHKEASDDIRLGVIESLMFRAADRLAVALLKGCGDGVWRKLAARLFDEEIEDAEAKTRLRDERRRMSVEETDLPRRLGFLVHSEQTEENEQAIADLLSDTTFPAGDRNVAYVLELANRRYPRAMQAAVMRRLERGLELPLGADKIVAALPLVDDGPIAALALDEAPGLHDHPEAAQIIGPLTIGKIVDRVLELIPAMRDQDNRPLQKDIDLFFNLEGRISRTRVEPFAEAILKRADTVDVPTITKLAELIARHKSGAEGQWQLKPRLEIAAQLGDALERWSRTLLGSAEASRHDFAHVVEAIARIPDQRHLPVIAAFLQEDLRRWREAREKWRQNSKRGPLNADTSESHALQYRAAIAAIGGSEALEVAASALLDDFVAKDFAHCLRDIHDGRLAIRRSSHRWPDFSAITEIREDGGDHIGAPAAAEAKPILAAIKTLIVEGTDERQHRRALDLAFVAFQMPCGQDANLVGRLLGLPVPLESKLDFLTVLATRGYVPSANLLLAGVKEWLDLASKDWWRRQQLQYRLIDWLQLLPFSDRPAAVLEGMKLVDSLKLPVWVFRDVISALAAVPTDDAERIIIELARHKPQFAEMHEWLLALLERGTRSAALLLIEYIGEAGSGAAKQVDSRHAARVLEPIVRTDAELQATLVRLYQDPAYASCWGLIEHVFAKAAGPDALLSMVRVSAEPGHRPSGWLRHAIEAAVTTHRSLGGNSYEIQPVPSAELRRQLYSMFLAGGPLAEVAKACLTQIDELRDEYGFLDEPRHPNINSGMPWPPLLTAENPARKPQA